MQYYQSFCLPYLQYMQCLPYNHQINNVQAYFNQYYNNFSYINLAEKTQLPSTQENNQLQLDTIVLKSESKEQNIQVKKERILPKVLKIQKYHQKGHTKSKKPLEKCQVQKQGRNSNSNLLRMFFRSLETRSQILSSLIDKIIQKHHLNTKIEKFLEWLEINKIDHKNYIRVSSVKKIFIGSVKQADFSLVMRILLKEFLKKEAVSSYLTSKKIKKSSFQQMKCNYRVIRNIFKQIYSCPSDF